MKLEQLIRKQVIIELTRIENRKMARAYRIEEAAKKKAKEEEEGQEVDAGVMNRSGANSPTKTGGVNFQDKSSTSSPTKASPKKSFAFSDTQTDVMSVSMGSKSSPIKGGFLAMMLGGG